MTLKSMIVPDEDHECIFKESDCDVCKGCGEHASFCDECGSECCGETAYVMD